jgi:hypothetical protein
MNEFISDSQQPFALGTRLARIRLFRFARGTTLIEIAVYYLSLFRQKDIYISHLIFQQVVTILTGP